MTRLLHVLDITWATVRNLKNKLKKLLYLKVKNDTIYIVKYLYSYIRHRSVHRKNSPLKLVCFVFPMMVSREFAPLSFHKLCVHVQVNKKKFVRNSSLEYHHVTYIGKTKHTS